MDQDDDQDEDHKHHHQKANDVLGSGSFVRGVRGDQIAFDVTVSSDVPGFDLHNYQIFFTASTSRNSPNPPVIRKSKADGSITVLDPLKCRITLGSPDTAKLPNQNVIYKYDVRIQDATGITFTVFSGDLEIRSSSSQPSAGINFPLGAQFIP